MKWNKKSENNVHYFLKESCDNTGKSIHCLINVQLKRKVNWVHYSINKGSDNVWKTTSIPL